MLQTMCLAGLCCAGVVGVASADGLPSGSQRGGGLCDDCVIELHIMVDQALFLQLGDGVRAYVEEVVTKMDAIWSQPFAQGGIGTGVMLSELTVFEDGDPWAEETSSIALVNVVQDFVESEFPIQPDGRDAVLLLSGVDLSTFGAGFVGQLCRRNGVGVLEAGVSTTDFVASSASHQLGHIAGAVHDGAIGGNGCADSGFIMSAPSVSNPATGLSSCSLGSIVEYLLSPGLDIPACLAPPIPECAGDLTDDGLLDFFDVSAFLDAFASQDSVADFTDDGIFDFFDVSAFLDAFGAGCP